MEPLWISPADAAARASVCTKTILRWIATGLPSTKLGKRTIRIRIDQLDAWLTKGNDAVKPEPSMIERARALRARPGRRP